MLPLSAVERTLLVPLMARAWGARWQLVDEPDPCADRVLQRLGCRMPDWPDLVTWSLILWRTAWFRRWAREFFARHPGAQGLNLGAGLSDYFQWLQTSTRHWVDADLQRVMQLREHCLPARRGARGLSMDVCTDEWWGCLRRGRTGAEQPCWIMLEGVLMYWTPGQVADFLHSVGEHVPHGSSVAFDVIPHWMVGHPIRVPHAQGDAAKFQWGIRSLDDLARVHPRLHLDTAVHPPTPWSLTPWRTAGWDPLSPYALVRMTVL